MKKLFQSSWSIKQKMILLVLGIAATFLVQITVTYQKTKELQSNAERVKSKTLLLQNKILDLRNNIYAIKDVTFEAISINLNKDKINFYNNKIKKIENKILTFSNNNKNLISNIKDKDAQKKLNLIIKGIVILSSNATDLIETFGDKEENMEDKSLDFVTFQNLSLKSTNLVNIVSNKINQDLTEKIHLLGKNIGDNLKKTISLFIISFAILFIFILLMLSSIQRPIKGLLKEVMDLETVFEGLLSSANKQAVSLEETAASIEEITGNIRGNTEKAVSMATLANESKDTAIQGDFLLKENSMAMEAIDESTNKIVEAISQIEQIAFQTNILSLNAAVEAATAGEHGKGFAVVAAEVRNLASMSAEVAKEIKALSVEATNKTNLGKDVSNDISKSFTELIQKITETSDLVDDVSEANKEQLIGMEQINTSSNSLDMLTQENTILVDNAKNIAHNLTITAQAIIVNNNKQ